MKTVNLELSKQLKEAGYPQKGHAYFWTNYNQKDDLFYLINKSYDETWELAQHYEDSLYASPTADEILDQLPNFIAVVLAGGGRHGEHVSYHVWENVNSRMLCAQYGWKPERTGMHQEEDRNLADAVAKMWLYLKGKELI